MATPKRFTIPAEFLNGISAKCLVVDENLPDGSAAVLVQIPPEVLKRLQRRAGTQDLGLYLWDNVFMKALISHVY